MIMINGNWEQVKDISDVIRIVSENIGCEFVQKVEEICGEPSIELEEENLLLQNKIENIKDKQRKSEELFIEVLNIADDSLENDQYDEYIEQFDSIWEEEE